MAPHQAPPSLGFSRQKHRSGLPSHSPMHESKKWNWSHSVLSDTQRPHGLQPTRLLHPWDFPGKSTGAGCHCLLWVGVLRSRKPWNMATKWCKYLKLRSYGKVVVLFSITINLSKACANQGIWGFPGGSGSKESTCSAGDWVWSVGRKDLLEKGMTTHSSILAYEIPWTEEPGGLQSMGSESQTWLNN